MSIDHLLFATDGLATDPDPRTAGPVWAQILIARYEKLNEIAPFSVLAFGAKGDGSTDDLPFIQDAFDAANPGGLVYFPDPPVGYRVTDSVHVGSFVVDGSNNVTGTTGSKVGITVMGAFGTSPTADDKGIVWDGPNQPGSTKSTVTDSTGSYPLVSDDKPVFSVVGGRHITFARLYIDGNDKAFAGIHTEGHHFDVRCEMVQVRRCRIGIRQGTSWDWVGGVQYWGYGGHYQGGSTVSAAGGWQADTYTLDNCTLLDNSIASYTIESAQANNTIHTACNYGCSGGLSTSYGVGMVGGHLTLIGPNFLGTISQGDVYQITGANRFITIDPHTESTATNFLTTTSTVAAQQVNIIGGDLGGHGINIRSGGIHLDMSAVLSVGIITRSVDLNGVCDLAIRNSTIDSIALVSATVKNNVRVAINNVTVTGSGLFTGAGQSDVVGFSSGIVTSGTPQPFTLYNEHVRYLFTTASGLAAGAGAGTSPPAPIRESSSVAHDLDGSIDFGTGTGSGAGVMVNVTFGYAYPTIPAVTVGAGNSATALLHPYVTNRTTSGFSIALASAPTDGQAAGVYRVEYHVGV